MDIGCIPPLCECSAGLVSYVVSPEAAFITAATLTIDGGYAA
jgi:hypothetical protein